MTVADMVRHPLAIALWVSFVTLTVPLMTYYLNRKTDIGDKMEREVSGKVDKDDCRSFRTRIGGESQTHTDRISHITDDITDIKEDVAFIRGKME